MQSPVTQAIFHTRMRARWAKVIRELPDKGLIWRTSSRRNKDSEVLILSAIKEVSTNLDPTPKKVTAKHPLNSFSLCLHILASKLNGQPSIGSNFLHRRSKSSQLREHNLRLNLTAKLSLIQNKPPLPVDSLRTWLHQLYIQEIVNILNRNIA